ncbi:MAG: hypothetical protein IPJ06_05315 [Saprospiraceae bacterium]|nr:hypothetical protein [Saprospiraceae bacterium]
MTLAETVLRNCTNSIIIQRVWTAKDNCGNSAQVSQKITTEDTEPPVLIGVPADNTIECGVEDIPPVPVVTATDNCDLVVSVVFAEVIIDGTCPGNYTVIRTWTASDNCGNTASDQQNIYVGDNSAPSFVNPPANVTVECDAVPAPLTVTAEDACDDDINVTFTEVRQDGTCPDAYTLVRTWTATIIVTMPVRTHSVLRLKTQHLRY